MATKKSSRKSSTPAKPLRRSSRPRRTAEATNLSRLNIPKSQLLSLDPPRPKQAESLTVAAGAPPEVQTIIYVHGIANKPVESVLKCQWDNALFGVDLGDRSRMAYWVNREYYPIPSKETCRSADTVHIDDAEASTAAIRALSGVEPLDERDAMRTEVEALTDSPARREWLLELGERMVQTSTGHEDDVMTAIGTADVRAKVLPLPEFLRKLIARKITRAFLRDVHDFLFDAERRRRMEQSLIDRLNAGGGPFVVIAHSQGSMIAYNVLRRLKKSDCDVRLFLTIGSPLGLQEVQDVLDDWSGLTIPECVDRWVNVADQLDPVSADPTLTDEFSPRGTIIDYKGIRINPDSPRDPHSATGYLRIPQVQREVRQVVGNAFSQPVGRFIIARDLVGDIQNGERGDRHHTLIQLSSGSSGSDRSLDAARRMVVGKINDMVAATLGKGEKVEEVAEIDMMKRFVAAMLTREEIERLRTEFRDLKIERVWRNAVKRALIHASTHTVQAHPANTAYGASGRGIGWAVLDTGIRGDHPHFSMYGNIAGQWDCTRRGDPVESTGKESDRLDDNGHGTHVAAIIAGCYDQPLVIDEKTNATATFAGMAPEARLYGYKVLDDDGNGRDSWIIKALDHIAAMNDRAGRLVIHGVNLSLGGSFDPGIYNCGHTPLCQELRRLWMQGVIVCLAAGNEGYALLQAGAGALPANMDLSIGDPANLEEAISIGSIHKSNPHTYGISYFSSRGPTADGRSKPDLVAPGEQILSAWNNWRMPARGKKPRLEELYIELSGTSMAAPHVSGLLAAFLSMRREFIGYPDRVKRLLLTNCTDLGRDPYIQGRGMPNLVKMLVGS